MPPEAKMRMRNIGK